MTEEQEKMREFYGGQNYTNFLKKMPVDPTKPPYPPPELKIIELLTKIEARTKSIDIIISIISIILLFLTLMMLM